MGRAAGHNWVRFCAETGGWDVSIEADEIFSHNPAGRRTVYRYQVEGPHALELVERLTGAPLPEAPWSHIFPCLDRRPSGLGPAAHDGRQPGLRVLRALG